MDSATPTVSHNLLHSRLFARSHARSHDNPAPARASRRAGAFRRHAGALTLYTLLSLVLTWPLVAHFTTHMPGDGIDDPSLAWNLWWLKTRLINQVHPDIFHVGWMFYPIEINLAFYTLTPLNGLLSIPLQTAATLVVANNLILLSSFVLGGYGVFLLVTYLLHTYPAAHPPPQAGAGRSGVYIYPIALLAGLFYAFASFKLFYASLGQFNIASSHWIPFCALYLVRITGAPTPRRAYRAALLAGLFLVFQAWAELTYASFLLIFAAGLYLWWAARLVAQSRARPAAAGLDRRLRTWLFSGLILGAVLTAGLAPFLAAMLPDMRIEGDFFTSGGGFADLFSADLMGYFFPTMLHPWLGAWVEQLPFPNNKGQQIFLGYSALLLAILGAWVSLRAYRPAATPADKRLWWLGLFWTAAALLFFLLSLGPQLRWAGQDLPVVGPFAWISSLPFFSGNRYPSRYSVMLMLCISVLAAFGLAWIIYNLQRLRSFRGVRYVPIVLPLVLALLFLAEHLSIPLPLNDARIPSVYATLAEIPGDFAILELPTGWRNGARVMGRSDELIMMQQWYQTLHGKRRLGGNTSRNPPYKFQYFTEAPLLGDLIALMNADRDHIAAQIEPEAPGAAQAEPDLDTLIARHRDTAPQVLHDLGIRYLLLHTESRRTPLALQRFVHEVFPLTLVDSWEGLDWTGQPAGIQLYALEAPVASETAAATDLPANHPANPGPNRTIDLAAPAANLYLAGGWSARYAGTESLRLAQRQSVDLLLPAHIGFQIELRLDPLYTGNLIDVRWHDQPRNDLRLQSWRYTDGILTIRLPDTNPPALMTRLTLTFAQAAPTPSTISPAPHPQPIGATGAALAPGVSLLVRSAGEEVGGFAHLFVNGHEYAANTRGYNLVALTPTGEVLDAATFDTHDQPQASDQMSHWLAQWPPGTIVAGAVADEASFRLSENAVAALSQVGVAQDLRDHFRWSHAFIGAAGAPPGTAHEAVALLAPAAVGLGLPLENSQVFAAGSSIVFPASVRPE